MRANPELMSIMITTPKWNIVIAIALATVGTSACSLSAQRRTAETFVWEGRLATGATVEIKGVNGAVQARPSTGATVRVEALRSGRRSDPAEVEIVVLEHSGGLTICAVYPSTATRRNECAPGSAGRIGSNNNDVEVEFIVDVPAGANLAARTTNGSVTAERLTGDVEAHSTNGDVRIDGGRSAMARTTNGSVTVNTSGVADVRTTNGRITAHLQSLDGNSPLRFSTTNGSITVGLPAEVNARLEASTTNGGIESEFPVTVQGRVSRNRLSGTIGAGGQTIEASTTNGGIRIERGG